MYLCMYHALYRRSDVTVSGAVGHDRRVSPVTPADEKAAQELAAKAAAEGMCLCHRIL